MPDEVKAHPPREEFTDIKVDARGRWFTGRKPIINKGVIAYFQQNLHRDDKGIYVFNRFGPFSEKGYIKVEGPVKMVYRVNDDHFLLLSGEVINFSDAGLVMNSEHRPLLRLSELQAWAGFDWNTTTQFIDDLSEEGDDLLWRGEVIRVVDEIIWDA